MLLQTLVFVAVGVYFVCCWTRSGQTLALKTWKLRIDGPGGTSADDRCAPSPRYLLALPACCSCAGAAFPSALSPAHGALGI